MYLKKKLGFFLFKLIYFGLDISAVGARNVTFVLSQFLEIGAKHAQRCRKPFMTSLLVRNISFLSGFVQSLILNQSKVFLAAQGFLSK